MDDISFDFETLSLDRDACILSLGAVRFDRSTGELGQRFYCVAEVTGQPGAIIDASTVEWWVGQSEEARQGIFGKDVSRVPLVTLLRGFAAFSEGASYLWSAGAKDAEWLESAFRRCGVPNPWRYWQFCDQRTVRNLFGTYIHPVESSGVKHNALDDAERQAIQLGDIFRASREVGLVV